MSKTHAFVSHVVLFIALLCTAINFDSPAVVHAADHPQTVWNAAELERLRMARTTTHAELAKNLQSYLDRHNEKLVTSYNVFGFAMMTRIMGDRDADVKTAIASLMEHCGKKWRTDRDLNQSFDIFNGAIGYDVLYDLLTPEQRQICRERIASSAKDMADAADSGIWWTTDLVQNHNWINFAAIGLAGQALEGEDPNAAHWQQIARADFQKVKIVLDLITDGSWHEGIGYMEFGLSHSLMYWLGAARRGYDEDKSVMLSKVGRYILYAQVPNNPRAHVMTHGDWNWSRPGLVAALRWAGRRFRDPFAQEAARRWDLLPRLLRQDFGFAYALEYVAYDPTVGFPDMTKVPLDIYNEDQQSVILRSSWQYGTTPPASDPLVLGFKAGVYGGRGNYERVRKANFPGGLLNYGHSHEDDLTIWLYGKGGWLLPEAVAYNCCTPTTEYHSTEWQNSFLFDGVGQLGDDKNGDGKNRKGNSKESGEPHPAWFYEREASIPLHVSTDHYAFARADGRRLYPASLGVTALLRTVGFCRENGGFVALQDRITFNTPRKTEQLFHSLVPKATHNENAPWLKLMNQNDTVLGIRVIAPSTYTAAISTQISNNFAENMDDDGYFGVVRLAPTTADTNTVFLELLWPTKGAEWSNRPDVQPLDPTRPQRGFRLPLGAVGNGSVESWIYNVSGTSTSAEDLQITGSSADDTAIKRAAPDGTLQRLVIQGSGKFYDQSGKRLLIDTGTRQGSKKSLVLEVAFDGTKAELSGTANYAGVRFYGPKVTEVLFSGKAVKWTRNENYISVK